VPIPYVRVNWQAAPSTTTPQSAANYNVMDQGIADLDAEINNTTGNDGVTQASTDGPFTFPNWLNFILKALRNITGKANWYDAPDATIAALNTNKLSTTGTAADSAKLGGVVAASFPQRGAHNAVAGFTVSMGDGAPISLAANEIYIQRS
jgi:hypothetical protein